MFDDDRQSHSHLRRRRAKWAWISLAVGGLGLIALLLVLNGLSQLKNDKAVSVTQFDVKSQQKKKRKVVKKTIKKKPKKVVKKLAPPKLSSMLRGSNFGLSLYQMDADSFSDSLLGNVKETVMTGDTVDQLPEVSSRPPLEFPKQALAQKISGYVLVKLLVDPLGKVKKVKLEQAEPEGIFESVALAAVREWEFEPAQYKGRPVAVWIEQKIRFDLGGRL
jgi:protein TonB